MKSRNRNHSLLASVLISMVTAILLPGFIGRIPAAYAVSPVSGTASGDLIPIGDAQIVGVSYVGPPAAVDALSTGGALPRSLAAGDLNEDGTPDLVAGFAAPDHTGIVVLYLGNPNAFAPRDYDSWLAIAEQRFPSPFVETAATFRLPRPPDFLATGNLQGNNHLDLIAAARGDNTVYILAGDGQGNLAAPQAFGLPGPITAMAVDRFGIGSLPSKLIVGVGGPNPSVLVYSNSGTGLSPVAQVGLATAPTEFAVDDMDDDGLPDLVIVAGGQISILHSMNASGKPQLETLSLPGSAVAVTTGFFVHDRAWRRQLAVVDANNSVEIVAHATFDPRAWKPTEVKAMRDAMRHRQPNPFRRTTVGPVLNGWKVIEIASRVVADSSGHTPILLTSRVFARGTDDILVISSEAGQMTVITHPILSSGANSIAPAQLATHVYAGGTPVAALSFGVNADARKGLVLLHQNDPALWVMMPVRRTQSSTSREAQ